MKRGGNDPRERRFMKWQARYHTPELVQQAEILPLRRDMVTLLAYVQQNKVVGTQSTGNMPLKAVRAVTARFVNPPKLDHMRSEADIWPLYFLHILAEVSRMVEIAPGRRWQVLPLGENFLSWDPLRQTSYLLTIWWYYVNWLIRFPFTGMGEGLPDGFQQLTLARLRKLPVGERIDFEAFADGLIAASGLTWRVQVDSAQNSLRSSIRAMVIDVLASFRGVERAYRQEPLGNSTISRLDAFEITPLGSALLEAVAIFAD
jgi:hypothetical protein